MRSLISAMAAARSNMPSPSLIMLFAAEGAACLRCALLIRPTTKPPTRAARMQVAGRFLRRIGLSPGQPIPALRRWPYRPVCVPRSTSEHELEPREFEVACNELTECVGGAQNGWDQRRTMVECGHETSALTDATGVCCAPSRSIRRQEAGS